MDVSISVIAEAGVVVSVVGGDRPSLLLAVRAIDARLRLVPRWQGLKCVDGEGVKGLGLEWALDVDMCYVLMYVRYIVCQWMWIHACMCTCMYVYMYVCMLVCVHACVHVILCSFTCVIPIN